MLRRIWLQHLMLCRKTLPLVIYPSAASFPTIISASSTRSLNFDRNGKIYTSQHVAKVKTKLDENQSESGNKIATIPNALCLFRIGLTPVVGYLIIKESYMTALALFAVSGITDW
ncbi:hypothetical protein LOAG_15474, partial [Loa loa]